MTCYIIELPSKMDQNDLLKMGVSPRTLFSCVNCFTADLSEWQMQSLLQSGAILTEDSECSLL